MRVSLLIAALLGLIAAPALAQAPQGKPTPVRGTIQAYAPGSLTVKGKDNQSITVAVPPTVQVAGVVRKQMSDIKSGDYVSSTSVPDANGALRALEVHIFPEAMRGQNEGQVPWDLAPGALMTNATVSGVTSAPAGQVIKVNYKGREAEVTIASDTEIVSFVPQDTAALTPGKTVFLVALKKPDGSLAANQVVVEKDGVKPPM